MAAFTPAQARALARVLEKRAQQAAAWAEYDKAVGRQGLAFARGAQPQAMRKTTADVSKAQQRHRSAQKQTRKAEAHARKLGAVS